jgi:hypothetical protein
MSAALWAGWALLPAFEAVTGALVTALDLGGSAALAFFFAMAQLPLPSGAPVIIWLHYRRFPGKTSTSPASASMSGIDELTRSDFERAVTVPPAPLVDPFARAITYLRVSVTDRCDFRCVYCACGCFAPRM